MSHTRSNQLKLRGHKNRAIGLVCAGLVALGLTVTQSSCETTYQFEELDVGSADDTREPRARENSQFVRAIYTDLLGRTPEAYELQVTLGGMEAARFPINEEDALLGALAGVGDPGPMRALITAGLVSSEEVDIPAKSDVSDPAGFIEDQFQRILGRSPSAYELQAFVREWESDSSVNPRTVIRALIGSREYQSF